MKKTKIILMAPSVSPYGGGIANWTQRILKRGLGPKWEILLVDEKPNDNINFESRGLKWFLTEMKRTFKIWNELKKACKDKDTKLVHIAIPSFFASMLREYFSIKIAKKRGKKVIMHFRSTLPIAIRSKKTLYIFKKILKKVDYVIVLNDRSKQFTLKNGFLNVSVVPNFIDQKILNQGPININEKLKTIVYTGMVIKEKGIFEVFEVAKSFPHITFILKGLTSLEIDKALKPQNIIFSPKESNEGVMELLKKSDLFLFPTYFSGEGFSNSLLEAMAVGLPCIATDWAANKDMLENKGGIIVTPKSADEIAKAIKILESSYERRIEFSKWNFSKAKQYSEDTIIPQYLKIYERLINE